MEQRKPLTPKEALIVKAKVKATLEGRTQRDIAREIYPKASQGAAEVEVSKNLNKPNVQEALQIALAEHGLTIDTIAKTVADASLANKVSITDGKLEETTLPDHSIRLKAVGMAAQFMNISRQSGDININFNSTAQNQRDEYQLS